VTFTYINDGNIQHTLDIDGKDGFEIDVTSHNETKSATINLPTGTYTLYCSVAGHRDAGMKATLTVK